MSEEHVVGILMAVVVTQNSFPHSQGGEQGKGASLSEYLSHTVAPRHKTSTLGTGCSQAVMKFHLLPRPQGPSIIHFIHV